MNQWKDGIVTIDNELVVSSGYTFNEFKKTSFYSGEDETLAVYLEKTVTIDNHKYAVILRFNKGIIYSLSLICCDLEISMEYEEERCLLHNQILSQYGLSNKNEFSWGKITSNYDEKGNVSSICFLYLLPN